MLRYIIQSWLSYFQSFDQATLQIALNESSPIFFSNLCRRRLRTSESHAWTESLPNFFSISVAVRRLRTSASERRRKSPSAMRASERACCDSWLRNESLPKFSRNLVAGVGVGVGIGIGRRWKILFAADAEARPLRMRIDFGMNLHE